MPVSFRNCTARFIWGFTVVWLGMLCAMSYVLFRDGVPAEHTATATSLVALTFWAAGIGLVIYAASKPCCFVEVHLASRISVTWRYPHKVVRKVIPRSQLEPAFVVDDKDSESDPYFFARIKTLDGEPVDIAESHTRAICEQACARFNQALFGRAGV